MQSLAMFIVPSCGLVCSLYAQNSPSQIEGPRVVRVIESPEEAFARFRKAVIADYWNSAFQLLTPASQEMLTAAIFFALYTGELGGEGRKLAAEAAEASAVEKIVAEIQRAQPEHQEAMARKLSALVKDRPAMLAKALKLFESDRPQGNWLVDMENTRLTNLKIEGDAASGEMHWTSRPQKSTGREPIAFERRNGSWVVRLMR
jgi:hypothetical protein